MSSRAGGSRHRGRELALQVLYAVDLGLRRPGRSGEPALSLELGAPADLLEETLAAAESGAGAGADGPVDVAAARGIFDAVASHFEAPAAVRDFAWSLVEGVCNHAAALDAAVASCARNWRISRMAAVDRNVLRLGAYELAHTATPAAVVMDEGVELARRFGSDTSPAFVNGILDALAHGGDPEAGGRSEPTGAASAGRAAKTGKTEKTEKTERAAGTQKAAKKQKKQRAERTARTEKPRKAPRGGAANGANGGASS